MIQIIINNNSTILTYNKEERAFYGSEKNIKFAIEYEFLNNRTGKSERFQFVEATGPEFDPNTIYVYKSNSGITLNVCNDPEITKRNAAIYLEHSKNT